MVQVLSDLEKDIGMCIYYLMYKERDREAQVDHARS